jgi:hypothetical protein
MQRRFNSLLQFVIAAAAATVLPATASACPACMIGDPKTAGTYLGMTIVMSALPMLIVIGLGYWLWRRQRLSFRGRL